MNTILIHAEQNAASMRIKSGDIACSGSPEIQPDHVKYEHEGYLIRVHFSGNKTFTQCIRNLAERRIES